MPVDIVVPFFNLDDAILHDCLTSIGAQTYRSWQAVVVDDASPKGDVSASVAAMSDTRFRSVNLKRHVGPGAARNTGAAGATGDLILFVDADDRLAPTFLERTVAAVLDSGADCAFTDFRVFGERDGYRHHRVLTSADMARRQWIPGPGVLMRRELFGRIGGYDESMTDGIEDRDFWLSAAEIGFSATHVPEPLYEKRYRALSHGHGSAQVNRHEACEYVYAKHRAFFDDHGAGNAFLAEGYAKAARAALDQRHPARALKLGIHASRLQPWRPTLWRGAVRRVRGGARSPERS